MARMKAAWGFPMPLTFRDWDVGFQTTVSCDHDGVGSGYHAEIDNSVSIGHAVIGTLEYHVGIFQQRQHGTKF